MILSQEAALEVVESARGTKKNETYAILTRTHLFFFSSLGAVIYVSERRKKFLFKKYTNRIKKVSDQRHDSSR